MRTAGIEGPQACPRGLRHSFGVAAVTAGVPLPEPSLLRHVSPLGWDHIVLTGDYDWNSGAAERTNVRPLNLYPAKIRA